MKSRLSYRLIVCGILVASVILLAGRPAIAAIDLNGNGISDIWEILHPLPADPDVTNQVTGVSYREASVWGASGAAASGDAYRLKVIANSEAQTLDVSWLSVPGKVYQLQSSTSFGDSPWDNDGEHVDGTGGVISISFPQAAIVKMYRLQVIDKYPDSDGVSEWEKITIGIRPRNTAKGGVVTSAFGDSANLVAVKAIRPVASEDGGDPGLFTLTRSGGGTQQLMIGYIVGGTASVGLIMHKRSPCINRGIIIPISSINWIIPKINND